MAVQIEKNQEMREDDSQGWDGRAHRWSAFAAGLVAGMSMTIAMLILLLLGVTPRSLANLVSDKIATVAGAGIQEFFIQNIGPLGKEILFLSVLIGIAVVGGLLGLGFAQVTGRTEERSVVWRNSFIMSTGFWLVFIIAIFPLLDLGFLGAQLETDQISTLVISFLLFQVFGLVFGYAYLFLVPTEATNPTMTKVATSLARETALVPETAGLRSSRRRFVAIMSGAFVLVVGAAITSKAFGPQLSVYRASLGDLRTDGTLEGEITPTNSFYQVSKNAFNPKVDGASWKMDFNGLVNKPISFDLASLKNMPQKTVYHTLTCISNPVGGEYIGNAQWTGVPFRTLLEMAGVGKGVQRVVFTCADGYKDSITIEKAMEDTTILALEMNGARLTDDHGFPARMLIPNIYGMKNAKWLTSITLVDTNFEGFWQKQGWDNDATIRTQSSIVAPSDNASIKAGELTTIKGVAFAGARNIEKVEVSTDNGQSWVQAQLKERIGPNSWTLWRLDWTPPAGQSKTYMLKVRAVEVGNKLQSANRDEPFPLGSSGYHTISIRSTL